MDSPEEIIAEKLRRSPESSQEAPGFSREEE